MNELITNATLPAIKPISIPHTIQLKPVSSLGLIESFKAEVDLNLITFPHELGEKHPFEFRQAEILCNKFGLANSAVDKHLDFIISPGYYVTSKNRKAQTLITDMIRNTGFTLKLRDWIKEGLKKGNGFMEIKVEKDIVDLKVINANYIYVQRDKRGTIIGYNQYAGGFNKFDIKKIISFSPDEIAHLGFNNIPAFRFHQAGLIYL